jgi:hypothetical protein
MGKKQDKPLVWLHGEIKTPPFSPGARIETGILLRRRSSNSVGGGFEPTSTRPKAGIENGTEEAEGP